MTDPPSPVVLAASPSYTCFRGTSDKSPIPSTPMNLWLVFCKLHLVLLSSGKGLIAFGGQTTRPLATRLSGQEIMLN